MSPPPGLDLSTAALFLDVDGTLVEIERHPDHVHVPDELCELLEKLEAASDGALALVSGRSIEQLDRLFSPLRPCAAGLHGLERRHADGEVTRASPDPRAYAAARAPLERLAAEDQRLLLEDKGLTLALHYRNAPDRAEWATEVARGVVAASGGAFVLLEGKMVLEIKPPGADKGRAIRAFMEEAPFAGRVPAFVGDDVTDEAGFETVRELGGVTVRIGDDGRPTAADYQLPDVSAAQAWLAAQLERSGRPLA